MMQASNKICRRLLVNGLRAGNQFQGLATHQALAMSRIPTLANSRFFSTKSSGEGFDATKQAKSTPNDEGLERGPRISQSQTMEFKAETRKLLDIVAKSIYTDSEVFIRELLSNCSDALEKQRFAEISGKATTGGDHFVDLITDEKERTLTIFDSGIGMTRD